jgi:hypothetical protein
LGEKQMLYEGKPEYEVRHVSDYFHVVCTKCGEACELDFRGYNGAIPQVEISCPKCGSPGSKKLHMGGHSFGKRDEWQQYDRSNPPDGVRLILEMADSNQSVSYGIGIVDHRTGELRILSQEEPGTHVVFWMLMP